MNHITNRNYALAHETLKHCNDFTYFGLRHPVVVFFHVCFRAAAILLYMFGGIFNFGFVPTFVTVVILLSLDFWVVKNITGKIPEA
jgi:hypothetical protein